MKKIFLVVLAAFCLQHFATAQVTFQKVYGGSQKDACLRWKNRMFFPNPIINEATIKFNKEVSGGILYLYNVYGQVILKQRNIYGKQIVINAENIENGVYVFEMIEEEKRVYTDKATVY